MKLGYTDEEDELVTILILIDGFLQYLNTKSLFKIVLSQSLF